MSKQSKLKYARTEKGLNRARVRQARWRAAHPERHAAQQAVYLAVKDGRLIRPDTCEHCGTNELSIEASHTDYENQLDVEWLCRPCHRIKDGLP